MSPWFRLAPMILLLAPVAALIVIVAVLELAYGKWRYTVRGMLMTMGFVGTALVVHLLWK